MDIEIKEEDTKGAAIAKEAGKKLGEMTFSVAGTNFIIIDHTQVEDGHQGTGVGKEMLLKVVEMARERELKIIPLCPFANAMFQKDSEIQDVLRGH